VGVKSLGVKYFLKCYLSNNLFEYPGIINTPCVVLKIIINRLNWMSIIQNIVSNYANANDTIKPIKFLNR